MALTTLSFGLTTKFYWAMITRFFQGSSMGMSIAVKALLFSICDDSNIAMGMSVMTASFSVGRIFGPCVSGKLSLSNIYIRIIWLRKCKAHQ